MPSSVHPEDHPEEDQAMVDAEEQQSQQNEEAPNEEQEEVIEMEGGRITVVRRDFSFFFLCSFFLMTTPISCMSRYMMRNSARQAQHSERVRERKRMETNRK